MPKFNLFAKRKSNSKSARKEDEVTPDRPTKGGGGGGNAKDAVTSPSGSVLTAATSAMNTPESTKGTPTSTTTGGHGNNNNAEDEHSDDGAGSNGSEEPWDVKHSLSEDGASSTGGNSNGNTGPSLSMKRKIQQRMNELKGSGAATSTPDHPTTTANTSVSSSPQKPVMLSLGRRSVRPLSPPAEAGMSPKPVTPSYDYGYDDDDDDDDDDDEQEGRRNNKNSKNKSMEIDADVDLPMDEMEEYQKQQVLCGVGSTGGEDGVMGGDNLCDYTLTALNDICGMGNNNKIVHEDNNDDDDDDDKQGDGVKAIKRSKQSSPSPPNSSSPPYSATTRAALRGTLPQLKPPYGVEEQTAIEVEYVEPERGQYYDPKNDAYGGANPRKKNLLVQAMARRAKQDYETQKGRPARISSPVSDMDKSMDESFEGEGDAGNNASSPPPPDNMNVYASFTSSEKRKFLTLINNGLTPSEATTQVLKERQEGEEAGDADSASKSSGGRGLRFWNKGGGGGHKNNKDDAAPVPTEVRKQQQHHHHRAAAAAAERTPPRTPTGEHDDDEEEEEERFARSGISYYDAVRKYQGEDLPPEEEGTNTGSSPATEKRSKNKRLARLAKFGFGKPKGKPLADDEDAAAAAAAAATMKEDHSPHQQAVSPFSAAPRDPPSGRLDLPPMPPRPVNPAAPSTAARSVPTDMEVLEDLEAAAEASRSVFKPIPSPASPTEQNGADPSGTVVSADGDDADDEEGEGEYPAIQESYSRDSLLDDEEDDEDGPDDEVQVRVERDIIVAAAPEGIVMVEEEKEEITSPETPQNRSMDYDQMEVDIASQILGVSSASQMPSSPARAMATDTMVLDVENTYMNSTEIMTHYNAGTSVAGDQPSVKTSATYATTGTNYTTSTRSRRPGAAKQRLTSQKTGETSATAHKYMGWQESIQAAAVGLGKVWDPVKGWVDYEEEKKSDDVMVVAPVTITRAGDSVSTGVIEEQAPPRDGSVVEEYAPAMMQQQQQHMQRAPLSPPRHGAVARKDAKSPARSRGWLETMKEATARVETQGKRWDPERGWIGPDGEKVASPDSDRYEDDVDVDRQVDSDTHDFGTILPASLQPKAVPPTGQSPPTATRDPGGQNPVNFIRKDPPPSGQIPQQHEDDHHSADAISNASSFEVNAQTGRYVQLGDTGSVSSYHFGKPSNRVAPKEKGTKLSSTPEHEDQTQKTPQTGNRKLLVDVKKEKVSPADASMFPEIPKGSGSRSTGPVDLDEIDDLENGSFEAAQDFSWDEDTFDGPSGGKSRGTSPDKSEISHSSVSTMSKTIPKLLAPTRDTSPIHGRPASTGGKQSPPTQAQSSDPRSSPPTSQVLPSSQSAGRSPIAPMPSQKSRTAPSPYQPAGRSPVAQMPSQKSRPSPSPYSPNKPRSSPPGSGPDRSLNHSTTSPGPAISDTRSTNTADSSPSVSSVKDLHDYWERRSNTKEGLTPPSAEWKNFLAKKVRDESAAAQGQKRNVDDERDSLFDFGSDGGAFPTSRKGNNALGAASRNEDAGLRSLEEISNLSPIQAVHDDDDDEDDDEAPSEVSTGVAQGGTFLERLQACAAPMMPKSMAEGGSGMNCNPMPMAHLAFLRNNPNASGSPKEEGSNRPSSKFVPPNLCGKPDIITEEDDEEASGVEMGAMNSSSDNNNNNNNNNNRPKDDSRRSRSNPRANDDMSSVISGEQFGQKTAYLEAIAMKAAVSGSKKNRRSRPSGGSEVGPDSGEKHSESWQRFLDKKGASRSEDQEEVSRAADKYAAEKVDQMMDHMAARSRSGEFQPRSMEEATGAFPSVGNAKKFKGDDQIPFRNESTRAAEDLAAARVEAMMHALSSPRTLDEEEGEI